MNSRIFEPGQGVQPQAADHLSPAQRQRIIRLVDVAAALKGMRFAAYEKRTELAHGRVASVSDVREARKRLQQTPRHRVADGMSDGQHDDYLERLEVEVKRAEQALADVDQRIAGLDVELGELEADVSAATRLSDSVLRKLGLEVDGHGILRPASAPLLSLAAGRGMR